jgi:transcriptional regulator with XRE-family HTH domain
MTTTRIYSDAEREAIFKYIFSRETKYKIKKLCESPVDIYVGKRLKKIRKSLGVSQDELGSLVGVTSQQIQKYETGYNRISASRLYEFSQIFKKPVSDFYKDYEVDKYYYNFIGRQEKELREIENTRNKELIELVRHFNRVKDHNLRQKIIELIKAIFPIQNNRVYD